jgi:hypothetical protein
MGFLKNTLKDTWGDPSPEKGNRKPVAVLAQVDSQVNLI